MPDEAQLQAEIRHLQEELHLARVAIRDMRPFIEQSHTTGHSDTYWEYLSIARGGLRTYDILTPPVRPEEVS
jgi:hypothetical protein